MRNRLLEYSGIPLPMDTTRKKYLLRNLFLKREQMIDLLFDYSQIGYSIATCVRIQRAQNSRWYHTSASVILLQLTRVAAYGFSSVSGNIFQALAGTLGCRVMVCDQKQTELGYLLRIIIQAGQVVSISFRVWMCVSTCQIQSWLDEKYIKTRIFQE